MIHVVTPLGGKPVASHHLAIHVGRGGDKAVEAMVSWPGFESLKYRNCMDQKSFHGLLHCQSIHSQCRRAYL